MMNISLNKLIPLPLTGLPHEQSGIWEAESVLLQNGNKYLFTAASGKGKTSLLSVLYGLREDYQGEVFIDGVNIRSFDDMQWAAIRKQRLASIFQGLELFSDISASDNILVKNRQTGYYSMAYIREMAALLELDRFLDTPVAILSYGQKQRVAIIRALCQPFDFLLADEIFSHLDHELSARAFSLVESECVKRQAGLLFTALHAPAGLEFDMKYSI